MKQGHFIVIDGTDGSGKATQVKLLRKRLQIAGLLHEVIEFPRYTGNPYGHLIRQYLNGEFGPAEGVNTSLISLAYAGDRYLAKPLINQWLKEKRIVIADRYVPSNKAYMAAKLPIDQREKFIDWLDDLEYSINGIPREELVIFLHLPSRVSLKNTSNRGVQDIHESNREYQEIVSQEYLKLSKKEDNWMVINCLDKGSVMKTPQQIHQEILSVLSSRGIIKL